jgi:hypothetical protein
MTDFEGLLRRLVEGGVEFVVIGGFAATAHGSAHVTVDLDIVYGRTPDNIRRLADSLAPLQPYLRGAPLDGWLAWFSRTETGPEECCSQVERYASGGKLFDIELKNVVHLFEHLQLNRHAHLKGALSVAPGIIEQSLSRPDLDVNGRQAIVQTVER